MKKSGVLNEKISQVIASLGHKDMLLICDAGLPVPKGVEKIDVAIGKNIPRFLETLKIILEEVFIEEAIITKELDENTVIFRELTELLEGISIKKITHEELKILTKDVKAVIRTGEFTPYANIILISGVVF